MVENGYQFSASDLIVLGNPAVRNGWTLAHEITSKGHFFRTSEILKLGNPQTRDGRTIAHVMAKNGRSFSESELARLGNLTGIEAGEYVPEFRIYVDASEEIGEMILAAAEKFMSSPYYNYKEDGSLDLSGGYGWDVKPPLVIFPINEDVKIIGHQIRDAIKLPRLRSYSSKYKQELEEKYKLLTNKMDERRRKFSSDKFYDRDNRLQFLASNAPNPEFYVRRYAHLIIEDDENDQYRIFERISSAHLPEIRIPLDCTDEELGWAVLEMTNRSSHE